MPKRQQRVSQTILKKKKMIKKKEYLPGQVFNANESALFCKTKQNKKPQGIFISNEEKPAPGFKAGKDRLVLLFCINVVGFIIRMELSIYLLTSEP